MAFSRQFLFADVPHREAGFAPLADVLVCAGAARTPHVRRRVHAHEAALYEFSELLRV
jgi:hypothetical protein